jgi:hypothetical protein
MYADITKNHGLFLANNSTVLEIMNTFIMRLQHEITVE